MAYRNDRSMYRSTYNIDFKPWLGEKAGRSAREAQQDTGRKTPKRPERSRRNEASSAPTSPQKRGSPMSPQGLASSASEPNLGQAMRQLGNEVNYARRQQLDNDRTLDPREEFSPTTRDPRDTGRNPMLGNRRSSDNDKNLRNGKSVDLRATASQAKPSAERKLSPPSSRQREHCSLGVMRLDYNYPPAPGDIDCADTFDYDVFYRVVPGLTFEMCQSGQLTMEVVAKICEAVQWFEAKKVSGISGDCGFMMYFQEIIRTQTSKPVFMSALAQLPSITCAFADHELIAILTANGESLRPMHNIIRKECGVDPEEDRFVIVGCEDVPGFEAVALGEKVNVDKVTPGIVAKAVAVLEENPGIRAFLMECTELPPYSDAVRYATGLPVFDAITCCNSFMEAFRDNKRFGMNGWQKDWDGIQDQYVFGEELSKADRRMLKSRNFPLK